MNHLECFDWISLFQPRFTAATMPRKDVISHVSERVTESECVVAIDVPGVKREDISVKVVGKELRVSAKRGESSSSRVWRLDHVCVADGVAASLENGVLTVKIPLQKLASRDISIS